MAEKAVIMCENDTIRSEDFFIDSHIKTDRSLKEILNLEQLEKAAIEKALEKSGGNVTQAAKELGISRRAFYYKTKKK